MSNVSNQHSVIPFIAGETKPLTGQRLAKVGYKKTKDQPNPPKSIAVSLPVLTDAQILENAQKILPLIRQACEDVQDKIIRSLYESREYSLERVSDDEIGFAQIAGYVSSEQSGGRLTKEYLEQWFDSVVRDNLTVIVADKLGFEELNEPQLEVVNKHIAGYKGLIASISGNKTMLSVAQITGIKRAFEVCAIGDEVSAKLDKKMDEMLASHNAQILAL